MSKTDTVGNHKTTIHTDAGYTNLVYHSTAVVKWSPELVILNSGGWRTVTTKLRMNQASNQYGLGYSVYQKNFEWFVDFNGHTIPFEDGMILERN